MATKRFTDVEKWKDSWFTDLNNDQKIIWIYIIDNCDNAGLWKINLKLLNFFCNSKITLKDLFELFKERITFVNSDLIWVNKFCYFQYGPGFLKSENKAVVSAIKKLIEVGLIKEINGNKSLIIPNAYPIDTLSIPYEYPIDTPKDKDKEQNNDKIQLKEIEKEKVEDIDKNNKIEKDELNDNKVENNNPFKDWLEFEINEAKGSIKQKNINPELKDILLNWIDGGMLTKNQRDKLAGNKDTITKLVPRVGQVIMFN